MPKLSVWFIRASLIYMSIGFLFGALVLLQKGILTLPWAWRLLLPHTEIMIFGWTLQFVMGVAFWILPRFTQEPRYGRVTLAWGSFAVFNAGMLLVIVGSWLGLPGMLLIGRLALLSAIVMLVFVLWPRVKAFAHATSHPS